METSVGIMLAVLSQGGFVVELAAQLSLVAKIPSWPHVYVTAPAKPAEQV